MSDFMGQFCHFRLARFTGLDRVDAKPLTLRNPGTDIYLCMSALRLSVARKVGSIVYGLLAGFATAMVFTIASVFLVALASWFLRYTNWDPSGEWSGPLGIVVAYYAFLPGVIVGAVVCWKVWRSGFRGGSVP